jgi:hypothetical protein
MLGLLAARLIPKPIRRAMLRKRTITFVDDVVRRGRRTEELAMLGHLVTEAIERWEEELNSSSRSWTSALRSPSRPPGLGRTNLTVAVTATVSASCRC